MYLLLVKRSAKFLIVYNHLKIVIDGSMIHK